MATGAGGADGGLSPGEAVGRLGTETRVRILQTRWATVESRLGDNACSSAALFDRVDLEPTDVPLVRTRPVPVDTATLAALGWESRSHAEAIERTVVAYLDGDRTERQDASPRETERRAIDALTIRP